jgi:hypothetical protein
VPNAMAIEFQEERKLEKVLIFVLIVLILILSYSLFKEKITPKGTVTEFVEKPLPRIDLNLKVFEDSLFQSLTPFPTISEFQEEKGRENPFLLSLPKK